MTHPADIPEEELLLPWYVSNRLSPEERARVDKALTASSELRHALDRERRLQAAVATAPLPAPAAADPDRLLAAAGVAENRRGAWLRPALAAAVVVAVVEGAALAWLWPGAVYRTASAPAPAATAAATRYAVHFVDDAPLAAIRAALTEAELAVVRGPLPDGAFILETVRGEAATERLARSGVARTIVRTD
jgi:ferric-dicitrate binding protein FerR (iron transport regulator)